MTTFATQKDETIASSCCEYCGMPYAMGHWSNCRYSGGSNSYPNKGWLGFLVNAASIGIYTPLIEYVEVGDDLGEGER